jgi:glycosyltransferase involved in cell wall biosynthesis
MGDQPRVLLVSPSAKPGGAERAFAALAAALPAAEVEPSVVLLKHGPLEEWLAARGCRATVAPVDGDRRAVAWLSDWALDKGISAIVSNKAHGHLVGGAAARSLGLPAVWWQHDVSRGGEVQVWAAAVPAAAIVCSSDFAVAAQRDVTPAARIHKVHPGADVESIVRRRGSGEAVRRELAVDGGPLIGIVGRLEEWKGQDLFLRAAARVAAGRPDARFAVVGGAFLGYEGTYPADLRVLAAELGIADRVHFAGHVEDVFPWLDALDVCVHTTCGEPFGLVLVEAMAIGTPLVAPALAGPSEIVEDGRSGLLVAPGLDAPLAVAVEAILADPELAACLRAGAEQRAWSFSEERMAEGFARVIRDVLAELSP